MLEKNWNKMSSEKELLPFTMGYLPEIFQQKAFNKLNDTPQNRIEELRKIKELMKVDKVFEDTEFEDEYLLIFLRSQSYKISSAFETLKHFLTLTKTHKYMFTHQKYEIIKCCQDFVKFLPYRCPDGCAVIHVKLDNWNPEEFPLIELKRMIPILLLHALRDPMNQVNGFKVIIDSKSNPLKYLKYCTFQNLYLMYHGTQNCFPGVFHEYHLVNPSALSKFCMALFMPTCSEELKKKIHVHSSPSELLDFFPSQMTPTCYGGELRDYDTTPWWKEAMQPEMLETLCGKPKHS